jgi:L-rhamnose mutarotase
LHNAGEYWIFDPDSNYLFAVLTRTGITHGPVTASRRDAQMVDAGIMQTVPDAPLQQSLEPVFHLNSLSDSLPRDHAG